MRIFLCEIIVNVAHPVAPVNGQDERRINAPPLTICPSALTGNQGEQQPKTLSLPFDYGNENRITLSRKLQKFLIIPQLLLCPWHQECQFLRTIGGPLLDLLASQKI